MRSLGPGKLVRILDLAGRRERRKQAASYRECADDVHHRWLRVTTPRRSLTTGTIDQRLDTGLLWRIRQRLESVLDNTLE